jgi:DNA repair protein RadD
MTLVPRDYQIEAVSSIYSYFDKEKGNPVIAMPTGTGKSVVIAMFLNSIFMQYPNQKVMIITHVKELIVQNYEHLIEFWPFAPAGIYSAGLNKRDIHKPIIFAGIASVAKRWAEFGRVDIVVIDEAHLLSPNDSSLYQKFLAGLKSVNPMLKVIGLTATPWRLGHGHIADGTLFDDVCFDITTLDAFNRLIAENYLSPLIPKNTVTKLDVSGVHIRGGEFVPEELQYVVDKQEITYAALREALEVAHDRNHWLIFASGVDHAEHIAEAMTSMGHECLAVHSKMPSKQRDDNIARFRRGEVRAVVNNNILTTGFNYPEIDHILCLRPTASTVLWVQMLGRGTRPLPGKANCLVLDFAGNTRRLGPINDPVVPHRKGQGGGEAPVKLCENCDTFNHISARKCINCGALFEFAVKIKATAGTDQLIKGDLPKTQVFKVDHITYRSYSKIGSPMMIKVSYYCGVRTFDQYVCVEHKNYAAVKAREWWKARTDDPMPLTTVEALDMIDTLPAPTHLRVWVNRKYPEILQSCFDGTAFDTQGPDEDLPDIEVNKWVPGNKPDLSQYKEEDIPF